MAGAAWLKASETSSKTDDSAFDISSAVCRLASNAILRDRSDCTASVSACSCSTWRAWRVMNATTVPAMATPMTIDHRSSSRARVAAACAASAVVMRWVLIVSWSVASVESRAAWACSSALAMWADSAVCGAPARKAPSVFCAATKAAIRAARWGAKLVSCCEARSRSREL